MGCAGMTDLPDTVSAYKRLPSEGYWDMNSLPKGLQSRHNTREGVWGKLQVVEGKLRYSILEPTQKDFILEPGVYGVIEPQVYHEVEILEPNTKLFLTFLK